MEQKNYKTIENLEQELSHIREEIERIKKLDVSQKFPEKKTQEKLVSDVLKTHIEETPEESLGKTYGLKKEEIEKYIEKLEPEEDDAKIEALFKIAMERGVINAVRVCEKLSNPHILDDFHRRLVYYFNYQIDGENKPNETKLNYLIIGAISTAISFCILFLLFFIF